MAVFVSSMQGKVINQVAVLKKIWYLPSDILMSLLLHQLDKKEMIFKQSSSFEHSENKNTSVNHENFKITNNIQIIVLSRFEMRNVKANLSDKFACKS